MCMRKRNILLSVTALFIGGFLYIFLREGSWIARQFPTVPWLVAWRAFLAEKPLGFFRYYLPDLFWGLSLSCALVAVYRPGGKGVCLCSAVAFGCGCLWEGLQALGVVSGTGDILDAVMYLLAAVICVIFNQKRSI